MIVVADDLGAGPGRDDAILEALATGLVDAASVLVNGPGFEEAVEQARSAEGHVLGVHLVLTDGDPLTEPIRRLSRFCNPDGRFRLWRGAERAFRLDAEERAAVAHEFRTQIEHLRTAGVQVAHLDSHHHVHTEPALAPIVVRLARELGVPRVRLARNCGLGMSVANRAWKTLFNSYLRVCGVAGTRWFGSLEDFAYLRARRSDIASFEVMVHPVRGQTGGIEDEEAPGADLAAQLLALHQASSRPTAGTEHPAGTARSTR